MPEASKEYADDVIILFCDNAPWHEGEQVMIPDNITILYIPPYTPEMNPIEQIWTEIRKRGFKNVLFQSLDTVVSKLCDVVNSLEASTVAHIASKNGCRLFSEFIGKWYEDASRQLYQEMRNHQSK